MSDTAKFDLLLNLTDTENGLFISLEYSTDLFDESASARITNRFNALLDRIVERRDARLQELVEFLIDEDKREELEKDRELENVLLSKFKSAKRRTISGTSVEAEK
jgi:non-ribosomal peptide synthetase component F